MQPEGWEDLSPQVQSIVQKVIRDGVSFGLTPRSARGRRMVKSIHWNSDTPNALVDAIRLKVEEDEMPLYLEGQKFMIRQVGNDETETR